MSDWDLNEVRPRFMKMATTNVSDALDEVGLTNQVAIGVRPVWNCPPICGPALTVRNIPAGTKKQVHHGGFVTAHTAKPGDVIVIDNAGDLQNNGWGGIVAWASKMAGAQGTVVDGAVRDVQDFEEAEYPVYAKGTVPRTARKRMVQDAINTTVRFCGVQVNPGDLVFADRNGIVFVPGGRVLEVLAIAERIWAHEEAMIREIRAGRDPLEVDLKHGYEKGLK
ncbi:MAG: RraA family protein [Firmicutes bacterium]|nr:RraA family protein [Bacillota bacterium]